jgi:hypothetical protein
MPIGDIFYIIAVVLFSVMTFAIIRGNFQRKFDNDGNRLDLKEKDKKE